MTNDIKNTKKCLTIFLDKETADQVPEILRELETVKAEKV